jgi:hypothetical protein
MQLKYYKGNKCENGETNSDNPVIFWSTYLGIYMHEILVLAEYSCRHEHGNRSVFIIALKNALVSRFVYLLAASPYCYVGTFRSQC